MRTISRARPMLAAIGFLIVAAFFLSTEHRAHLFGLLPFLLLLACSLLHMFGHGGHGGHAAQGGHARGGERPHEGRDGDNGNAVRREDIR